MNANSQRHGVRNSEGERFFGLRDYCRQPRPSVQGPTRQGTARQGGLSQSGATWQAYAPPAAQSGHAPPRMECTEDWAEPLGPNKVRVMMSEDG